jgi:TrmH family RNA methyltransferase
MTNFGAAHLRVVNPYAVAFREARSAVGAAELLKSADEFETLPEAIADCSLVVGTTAVRSRLLQHPLHRLDQDGRTLIHEHLPSGRVALLFGSEKFGLANDDFSHCHWILTVPTLEGHISMNLGQAVAVCLYELSKGGLSSSEPQAVEPATAGHIEQISQGLLKALYDSGYVKPGNDAMCEKKVRRLVRRFHLDALDAKVLLGMVRQIRWKLDQKEKSSGSDAPAKRRSKSGENESE